MTTVNQLICRMHDGHKRLLECARDGVKIDRPSYGQLKAWRTLSMWGAVSNGTLTETGIELLTRWNAKYVGNRVVAK